MTAIFVALIVAANGYLIMKISELESKLNAVADQLDEIKGRLGDQELPTGAAAAVDRVTASAQALADAVPVPTPVG